MNQFKLIGMDTSKRYFQLHGVNASERPVLRKTLPRERMIAFFQALPATVVALEACGASHHWGRVLSAMGHRVKLIAPQLAKPYVKRGQNDAADAEALCEAASRPSMRFVAAKTAEQQAQLMLATARERLVSQHTQIANAIRGHAAEFGLTAAKGTSHIAPLLAIVQADAAVPAGPREMLAGLACDYAHIEARLAEVEAELHGWFKSNEMARKLTAIPGVGPLAASLLAMKIPDPHAFETGRDLAAWIGRTPRDHSTAGKTRLGRITRAGDETRRRAACWWWGDLGHPSRPHRPRAAQVGLVGRTLRVWPRRVAHAQAAQACRGGAGQQDRPCRLEADDQPRGLCRSTGSARAGGRVTRSDGRARHRASG